MPIRCSGRPIPLSAMVADGAGHDGRACRAVPAAIPTCERAAAVRGNWGRMTDNQCVPVAHAGILAKATSATAAFSRVC